MKILFINTGPWGTGSFTVIKGLTKVLIGLGHEVKILFPDANFESIDKDEYYKNKDLYDIWHFPLKNKNTIIPTFPLMITDPHPRNPHPITFKKLTDDQIKLYEKALKKKILHLMETFNPDIIECHHIWYSSWICCQLNLDYLAAAHHSDQLGFRYDKRIQAKALASAQSSKAIIAISESVKNEVKRIYHVDESKIFILTNGYDKDIFQPRRLNKIRIIKKFNLDINQSAFIVSFAGKLSKTKGMDVLIQSNKLLDPAMNIHFIIMGAGSLKSICKTLDKESYSLNNMHFIGHQIPEHVAEIHNISNMGVMPSRSEGFGIACLEAMGCGLPMVVSRSGGPEHFAIGKIIDKGSPEQLAQAIIEIYTLPKSKYHELSQCALSTAQQFSWKKIAKQRLNIYKKVITGKL